MLGDLSDRIGRKPPIVIGSLLAGLLAFAYLYAISIKNAAGLRHLDSDVGVVSPRLQRGVPELLSGVVPDAHPCVGHGDSQNVGTLSRPCCRPSFTAVAPPGATNIWLTVGAIAFGVTVIAAVAAMTARETYRIHMDDLGQPAAQPVDKAEYARQRAGALVA
ncbi:hypothetical protein ACRAWF_08870 [Streptomyces sp. L7]